MNERDSEIAAALLEQHGYAAAADEQSADIILVNTCSVRAKAEEKALGKIGLLLAARRQRPHLRVGVMGCMAQRMQQKLFELFPGLDFALTPAQLADLPQILQAAPAPRAAAPSAARPPDSRTQPHLKNKISAFINILYGCNRRCSYCIVPDVRGSEYSRPPSEILEEAQQLTAGGTREITLLGQSVMQYGRQPDFRWDAAPSPRGFKEPLPRLLELLGNIPGLWRLRFTSGHPSGCTAELAQVLAALPQACAHLHLPLQSGSDRILKMMRRGYTVDEYRAAVQRLRDAVPGMAITTDIIVGFPTETPADFAATVDFMEEMNFDNAFIFKYNPRPGTPAAQWADDVPAEEKLRRNHALIAAQNRRSLAINRQLQNTVVEVLAEGPSRRNPGRWSGRTRTNKIAVFEHINGLAAGDLIQVKITHATAQALYGIVEGKVSMRSTA